MSHVDHWIDCQQHNIYCSDSAQIAGICACTANGLMTFDAHTNTQAQLGAITRTKSSRQVDK